MSDTYHCVFTAADYILDEQLMVLTSHVTLTRSLIGQQPPRARACPALPSLMRVRKTHGDVPLRLLTVLDVRWFSTGSFGSLDEVSKTVLPEGEGISSTLLDAYRQGTCYVFDYIVSQEGRPETHIKVRYSPAGPPLQVQRQPFFRPHWVFVLLLGA